MEALNETAQLLKANPELNAIWNYRKNIITTLKGELDNTFWENELTFSMARLKEFPKVYWIWGHRVWTLNNYPSSPVEIWKRELLIVSKLLELDARNYHGWHYRRIVIAKIEEATGETLDKEELEYTTAKINNNISNFSSWHQRANLLPRMFKKNELTDKKKFINDEVSYITNAMFTDAEDQSVWLYMKWFIKNDILSNTLSNKEYLDIISGLKENIVAINEDELEFSGKQNNWCLKILIVIEDIQQELGVHLESKARLYLEQLIEGDHLRKKRYIHLLNKH